MRNCLFWILFVSIHTLFAQQKLICISVDDLPVVSYGITSEEHEKSIVSGILSAFDDHNAPGIGYVNAGKLFSKDSLITHRVELLEIWLDAGYELGNHTYSHKNYHRVPFEDYAQDILDGEKILVDIAKKHKSDIRFFRHPYLRSGMTAGATDSLKQFLVDHNYQEAFVTVDNDDYLFALAYSRAFKKSDTTLMKQIGSEYVSYMEAKLNYFERISIELFGRNIKHTLMLHTNLLNAHYLDSLLQVYEEMGYTFISQEEASDDPAYSTPVTEFGDWGISWIHKWGKSAGKEGNFFTSDPALPKLISDLLE